MNGGGGGGGKGVTCDLWEGKVKKSLCVSGEIVISQRWGNTFSENVTQGVKPRVLKIIPQTGAET